MLPQFLFPENIVRADGVGPAFDLDSNSGQLLVLTLGINRIIEQESLDVVIRGSEDGSTWDANPVAFFPQKFYCGVYSILVNLNSRRQTKFLRIEWKLRRWGRGDLTPLFGFYVFAQESGTRIASAVA